MVGVTSFRDGLLRTVREQVAARTANITSLVSQDVHEYRDLAVEIGLLRQVEDWIIEQARDQLGN